MVPSSSSSVAPREEEMLDQTAAGVRCDPAGAETRQHSRSRSPRPASQAKPPPARNSRASSLGISPRSRASKASASSRTRSSRVKSCGIADRPNGSSINGQTPDARRSASPDPVQKFEFDMHSPLGRRGLDAGSARVRRCLISAQKPATGPNFGQGSKKNPNERAGGLAPEPQGQKITSPPVLAFPDP